MRLEAVRDPRSSRGGTGGDAKGAAVPESRLEGGARNGRDGGPAEGGGVPFGVSRGGRHPFEWGRIFSGINVESPSYGLTVCAERTAVYRALSEGARRFRAVAVVTSAATPTPPCGACRQVLWDQCGDIEVIMQTTRGKRAVSRLSALLPNPFGFRSRA